MKNVFSQKNIVLAIVFFLLFGSAIPAQALHRGPETFPRLSNYFLRAGTDLTPELIPLLARYDLLVLPAEAQIQNPSLFQELRKQNPDIVILAYLASTSFNFEFWHDALHNTLLRGIQNNWWLLGANHTPLSIWPGTRALDLTTGWAEYLARFSKDQVMATGLWDGIFFDEVGECIACGALRAIDLNRDGLTDRAEEVDAAWRTGTIRLLQETRALLGEQAVIIINGSSTPAYQPHVNGRMFESFPTPWEANGSWEVVMQRYLNLTDQVGDDPAVLVLDGDTENSGISSKYRDVRFGLTSALLGNGYFGYSSGTQDHGQTWWYDEYSTFLGKPLGLPKSVLGNAHTAVTPDLWRRDFEEGLVLVNATGTPQTVALDRDFEKIHGTQDPSVNDGSIVQEVALAPQDGTILLRLVEQVEDLTFPNGSFTRILKSNGEVARTGFFLSEDRAAGGSETQRTDLDGDGVPEIVVASGETISVWHDTGSTTLATWSPYGPDWHNEIHFAIGDTNGDGSKEIVTVPGKGGGPQVRIFSGNGRLLSPGFFAFEQRFRGGINVALGDIDPTRPGNEIVVGRGPGGRAEVRVFRADGAMVHKGFEAYTSSFRGGVYVAAGDVDGDGAAEIVTGAGRGGGPHVRIFNSKGVPQGRGFFPYQKNRRNGVRVGVIDLDGNGVAEIFAMTPELD